MGRLFLLFPKLALTGSLLTLSPISTEHMSTSSSSSSLSDLSVAGKSRVMICISCKEDYEEEDSGTCKECYEEASETEDELHREIHDLRSKIEFLRFSSGFSYPSSISFSDVVLVAADDDDVVGPVPAHKALLASRSPVFKAMLETEMEESLSGTIKISDVSYDSLCCFVNYLYTAEANLDDQMACNLLVLAEKYQVKHLKTFCEKFLVSRLNWDNALLSFAFAHQHNAEALLDSSLSLIIENMDKLSTKEEYIELVEKDAPLVVQIYEAYLSKQVNTAARKDPPTKL